jgi:putative membrane-bound dehydrogenase-like protein
MKFSALRFAVAASATLGLACAEVPRHPKFGFPVYTNVPSGRQLSGQHAPASTPALSPEEAQKRFTLPKGFEIRLFASEPEVVNPVAMSWDHRGRLWVVELYEYPLGTQPGEKGRDRIKILEDTDGDGLADKVSVFAEGFTLATGLLLANNGVYLGAAPNLLFLEDTDGDDRADRQTIVQTGFGLEDRHELLNGFAWGPDGQLYMTHGVFTHTRAVNPDQPGEPVVLTAGVARFDTRAKRLEVFAEGTSNPWGVDFDARGNAFVSACVIDHFFHLAPGGLYQRQAGQPPYPYAYELLPSIVDHRHHMAAYAGVDIYLGDQYPAEFVGMALQGNIHDNAIHRDRLTPRGSTFVASADGDFVRANDGWFMPVSMQTGPDGAVWIMDWYDKYPCYQNANADPSGVDRERGRVWRVVWTGDQPGKPVPSHPANLDLGKASSADLVKALAHPNAWHRQMAQRILSGRSDASAQKPALVALMKNGATEEAKLAALWTLFSSGQIDDAILDDAADAPLPSLRMWAARFTGERRQATDATHKRLLALAADEEVIVQAAVATALRQNTSGSLTVNTPPPHDPSITQPAVTEILGKLLTTAKNTTDRDLPFLIWTATEPVVMYDPNITAKWFEENGESHLPLAGRLAYKTIRRFCDERKTWLVDKSLEIIDAIDPASPLMPFLLDGLIDGQRGKSLTPGMATEPVLKKLLASSNEAVAAKARQLGSIWGDASALRASLEKIADAKASDADRLQAIQSARRQKSDDTRKALLGLVSPGTPEALQVEAVRALSEVGLDDTGREVLNRWTDMTPAVRGAASEMATTRWQWKGALFSAIERGDIKRGDLPPTVIRTLATSKNDSDRVKAEQLFGKVRGSSEEKLKLIAAKRKVVVEGAVDLAAGREVARKTCFICHKLHGEGAEIGPDLTGVGRSSLDALLHNVINPNEIIGQGYEQVEVETKDDQTLSGRMVENTATRVRLVMAGPTEEVIDKSNVKALRITENSAMPEGLEQMPDADFRNLIWYILAPPEDGKPLTPERRRELSGGQHQASASGDRARSTTAAPRLRDGESIALWAPGWQVDCPDFEEAPAKIPEFAGRRNVLVTHPVDERTPAAIVRALNLAQGTTPALTVAVAAHERGDWELRVVIEGEVIRREPVNHEGGRWKTVRIDLAPYAGRRIVVRLENAASGWNHEFGYWADLRLDTGEVAGR